jgi:hypothetical protein
MSNRVTITLPVQQAEALNQAARYGLTEKRTFIDRINADPAVAALTKAIEEAES